MLVHQPVKHGHGVWHWQIIFSNYPHIFAVCQGHNFRKIAGKAHIRAVLVIFDIKSRWRLLDNAGSVVAGIIIGNTNLKTICWMRLGRNKRVYAVCQVRRAIASWDADWERWHGWVSEASYLVDEAKICAIYPCAECILRLRCPQVCIAVRSSGCKLVSLKIGVNRRAPEYYRLELCSDVDWLAGGKFRTVSGPEAVVIPIISSRIIW